MIAYSGCQCATPLRNFFQDQRTPLLSGYLGPRAEGRRFLLEVRKSLPKNASAPSTRIVCYDITPCGIA
jgi:hypothetical protein